jgi:cell division protein FtsW (lipid II flippase)
MNPYSDPQKSGFQIMQSLIAIGTGGVTGLGLMEGRQKLFYLPEPHTDFIFAVTAEELGLVGSLIVVGLFGIFIYRAIRAAVLTSDTHARFIATGVEAMIGVQALFNMSVVMALLPNKGIPLPFISYGGSSLFITLVTTGILLNVTQATSMGAIAASSSSARVEAQTACHQSSGLCSTQRGPGYAVGYSTRALAFSAPLRPYSVALLPLVPRSWARI